MATTDVPQGILDVIDSLIGFILNEVGFSKIEPSCLYILSNLFISFVEHIGYKSITYAEVASRTKLIPADLIIAFIDSGINVYEFLTWSTRPKKRHLFQEPLAIGDKSRGGIVFGGVQGPGGCMAIPKPLSLRLDHSSAHPTASRSGGGAVVVAGRLSNQLGGGGAWVRAQPMAPAHLRLPSLPEAHTYMRTRVSRPSPASNLTALRRRTADQHRQLQLNLNNFLSKSRPVHYLFSGDSDSFALLLPQTESRPYLSSLMADFDPNSNVVNLPKADDEHTLKSHQSATSEARNFFLEKPLFPSANLDSPSYL